jgi:predicted phosphodiesterase
MKACQKAIADIFISGHTHIHPVFNDGSLSCPRHSTSVSLFTLLDVIENQLYQCEK